MNDVLTTNNGVDMPALGLGVFQNPADQTADSVAYAIEAGYRLVDTAAIYGNERAVGEGIRQSGIGRDDIFIETKVWVSDYGHVETLRAYDKAADKLGVDMIDMLLLHHPAPVAFDRTIAAYQALEHLLSQGRVRAIGVSNFLEAQLNELRDHTTVVPALNQVELHPYFTQEDLQQTHSRHGIITQAWSPIGGITFYPGWGHGRRNLLEDPGILAVAAEQGRTAAQVMLRWHRQQGRAAVPKSSNPARIAQNFAASDFTLSVDQIARIDALDRGVRIGPDPDRLDPAQAGSAI